MHLKTLEQQLKKQNWSNNFNDAKMVKKLSEQTANALDEGEEVYSLTGVKKVDQAGELSKTPWLLVLTKKELCMVELDSDEEIWHSAPVHLNFTQIRMVEKGVSHRDENFWRINIISNEKGFVFESIDTESAVHLVEKANLILKGDNQNMNDNQNLNDNQHEETLKTLHLTKSKDFQNFETVKASPTNQQPNSNPKKSREDPVFGYFFNFSSLLKSRPVMEILFLIFQLVWIVCDIVAVALYGRGELTDQTALILGIIMLIFNILDLGILVPYLMAIWKKGTITNKARIFIVIGFQLMFLIATDVILIVNEFNKPMFDVVSLPIGIGIFVWVAIEFSKKVIEEFSSNSKTEN